MKEDELKIKNLEERKMFEKRITEEKRIKDENERIKQWEIKFDADLAIKEDELNKKFYSDLIKDNEAAEGEIIKKNKENIN